LFHISNEEIKGKTDYDLFTKDKADVFRSNDLKALEMDSILELEEVVPQDDGDHTYISIKFPLNNSSGEAYAICGISTDITQRKNADKEREELQMQLNQAQKMDAIGQMAGGIAHDFNNILSIVLGNISLLKLNLTEDKKVSKRLDTIEKATRRATDLTKQLLSFSRKEPSKVTACNMNKVVEGMDSLISRTVTPKVMVELNLTKELWLAKVDIGGLEDALLNLIINARDAMPDGGQLTIATRNTSLDLAFCKQNPEFMPGDYVQLTVSDTGEGISVENQKHIFEPFFTTKPQGKGTGLGLSMVFGLFKRSGGTIKVNSELGAGTTFNIYLPRTHDEQLEPLIDGNVVTNLPKGSELILAVDDEESLLELAKESLETLGYKVLTASDGKDALEYLTKEPEIALLFSDIVMPGGISGYDLAEQAITLRPELKVLLTSGYTQKVFTDSAHVRFNEHMLHKPYSQSELANKLRMLLGNLSSNTKKSNTKKQNNELLSGKYINWSNDFSVGIKAVDDDHKKLLAIYNRCLKMDDSSEFKSEISAILSELVSYTKFHFRREEAIMKSCGYPGLSNHKQIHKLLIANVGKELKQLENGHLTKDELLSFLGSWLIDHIMEMDRAIAPYCQGKDKLIDEVLKDLQ